MLLEKLVIPIGFDMGLLLEGINAIKGLITGAIERTQQWAEDLDKLGDVTGMSTDNLAAWSYAAEKAGVETDVLARSSVILAKGLVTVDGELDTTGKALEAYGVSVFDTNGKVKEQSVLLADISKKYAELGTQTQRVDFLTSIFGRNGAQLIDVFDTMAQSGGIDAVKQKVQDLGLVLDPAQYENFQRNLGEVQLTFTGLANAFTGPLMPAAEKLLGTFTAWLQSPWIADGIRKVGENFGIAMDIVANFAASGDLTRLATDIKTFTGIDIQPLIAKLGEFSAWVTDVGIPKWNEFIANAKINIADFRNSTQVETAVIEAEWLRLLAAIGERLNLVFGTEGISLIVDWKQIGITALQLVAITLHGLAKTWEFFNDVIRESKDLLSSFSTSSVYVPPGGASNAPQATGAGAGANQRASGGSGRGMTWINEKGPELVDLPNGSYVNNAQSSESMGFDYYKLAAILAVEFAKARD